ncbi:hypothetical protein BDZ89DRAFT_359548 [Hymenopellis radicata]|nr:hypothetical protein BDZ89DRAFT_359548 [Hymenopellis radicata]
MTSSSTNSTSIGLTPSNFLALAERAAQFRSAWQKFSDILIRVGQTSVPTTAPTDNPDNPLNTAITIFKGLSTAIYAGCLSTSPSSGSQYAMEGATVIIGIMPYLRSWITYIMVEVVVPGREPDFRENLAEVVSTLVCALVGARTHPRLFEYIIALEALDGTRTQDQTFFLSGVIPPLVFHSTSSTPRSRTTVLRQCFMAVGYLMGRYTHYDDLPLYGRELYDNLCADPEVFADLFLSCVIDAVIVLKAHVVSEADFKDCTHFLGYHIAAYTSFSPKSSSRIVSWRLGTCAGLAR